MSIFSVFVRGEDDHRDVMSMMCDVWHVFFYFISAHLSRFPHLSVIFLHYPGHRVLFSSLLFPWGLLIFTLCCSDLGTISFPFFFSLLCLLCVGEHTLVLGAFLFFCLLW